MVSGEPLIADRDRRLDFQPEHRSATLLGDRLHGPYRRESLQHHREEVEFDHDLTASQIVEWTKQAGLLGRGGAAFPLYRKLIAVATQGGDAVVVANGAESEPDSHKDRTLLLLRPHLVLDGAVLAAKAVGASTIYLYLHGDDPIVLDTLQHAVSERRQAHYQEPVLRIVTSPRGYVAGESSAAVSYIGGGEAKPVFGQRSAVGGVDGRPTLVSNVETLAHLALIATVGVKTFRSYGSPANPGSRLFTVGGAVPRQGVVLESLRPQRIGDLLEEAEALSTTAPQAILLGGFAGTFIDGREELDFELSEEQARMTQRSLGCGFIGVVPHDACGLYVAARLATYLARETAGQCGPCVHGLAGVASRLWDLVSFRSGRRQIRSFERAFTLIEGRGACSHPDAAVTMVRSALLTFADEVERHLHGRCRASEPRAVFNVPEIRP